MIPYTKDRFNSGNAVKFLIKPSSCESSWKYYYTQYVTAFDYLLGNANLKHYRTNCQFMSFMFLFRHSVELMLKYEISLSCKNIPNTHVLSELSKSKNERFIDLVQSLHCLYPDDDGSQFRYYEGKDGTPYFRCSEILNVIDECNTFIHFCNSEASLQHFQSSINSRDKTLRHEMSFYTTECRSIGNVRAHFDFTLDTLVCGITNDDLDVNDVYLPILFLIRHGLEIAIKDNLFDLGCVLPDNLKVSISKEHNLYNLHKMLSEYLSPAIKLIPEDNNLRHESEMYNSKLEQLKDLLHNLDTKSYAFRYPSDKNLKFKKDEILLALQLYYETDAFLSNAVLVLFEAGYLTIGDDIIYHYYYE